MRATLIEGAGPVDERNEVGFRVAHTAEPHFVRRAEILKKHPEIRALMGHDARTAAITAGVVVAQLGIAYAFARAAEAGSILGSYWVIAPFAYVFGAILSHWAGQTIHECSHDLAFARPWHNRALALFANLPMVFPIAETFRRYHLDHHTYLGVDTEDTDLPIPIEVRNIGSSPWRKFVWLALYFFVYFARGLTFIRGASRGEAFNFVLQMAANVAIYSVVGVPGLVYLAISTIVGHSLHPVAAHFIHEHYIFDGDQETYSYYGPLNKVTFNVGYHVEHHDFMNVPGSKLPALKGLAPEYYDRLTSHGSWTWVLWHFVSSRVIGAGSRIVRTRDDFERGRREARAARAAVAA